MASLKSRRNTDRLRQQKWRNRQQTLGKKQISAMISLKAQIILNREKRRSGENTSQIIERALMALVPCGQQSMNASHRCNDNDDRQNSNHPPDHLNKSAIIS